MKISQLKNNDMTECKLCDAIAKSVIFPAPGRKSIEMDCPVCGATHEFSNAQMTTETVGEHYATTISADHRRYRNRKKINL